MSADGEFRPLRQGERGCTAGEMRVNKALDKGTGWGRGNNTVLTTGLPPWFLVAIGSVSPLEVGCLPLQHCGSPLHGLALR